MFLDEIYVKIYASDITSWDNWEDITDEDKKFNFGKFSIIFNCKIISRSTKSYL